LSELADITQVLVPGDVMTGGYQFMRAAGKAGLEGMVLWLGTSADEAFTVKELFIPEQRGLRTADGVCAIVGEAELRRLNVYLYKNSLELIAQIHTHPRQAYHSTTDDQYAIATTIGSYSIVVPNFARVDYPLGQCAVYRLSASGDWIEVDESTTPNRITVI
jgi:hypothetical protein